MAERCPLRAVLDRWRDQPYSRAFCLGILMAFLPCMLVFWCLGLAASASHPFDGALLMALLVVMTTPVLLLAAIALDAYQPLATIPTRSREPLRLDFFSALAAFDWPRSKWAH